MSPISVGIDLGQSQIPVGGLALGKYIVVRGDKGIKLNGPQAPSRSEVVEAFHDATQVVKSFFGAPKFQAAVVVVPNFTKSVDREAIIGAGRGAGFNITQLINENVAVAAAYAEIVNPASKKRLAIVSDTGGVLDVSVISVDADLEFELVAQEIHREAIESGEEGKQSGPGGLLGLVGGAVKTLVVDPLDKAFDVVKKLLSSPKLGESAIDVVIFVGKAEKLKEAVRERFPDAAVWSPEGVAAEEVAAYGAGGIAFKNKTVRVKYASGLGGSTVDFKEARDEAEAAGLDDQEQYGVDSVSV